VFQVLGQGSERRFAFLFHAADVLVGFVQRLADGFDHAFNGFFPLLQLAAGPAVQDLEVAFREFEEFAAVGFQDVAGQRFERGFELLPGLFEGAGFFRPASRVAPPVVRRSAGRARVRVPCRRIIPNRATLRPGKAPRRSRVVSAPATRALLTAPA
jgi:hypothetical protein